MTITLFIAPVRQRATSLAGRTFFNNALTIYRYPADDPLSEGYLNSW